MGALKPEAKFILAVIFLRRDVFKPNAPLKLLKEVNKRAAQNDRVIDCLLQIHIAQEETKFGLDEEELNNPYLQIANMQNEKYLEYFSKVIFLTNNVNIDDILCQS